MDSEKIKDLFDIDLDAIPFEKDAVAATAEESTPPSFVSVCWWC
ncbi:hypothetical protein [Streptomyces sp. CA-111067]|jgi:hypothetical protein